MDARLLAIRPPPLTRRHIRRRGHTQPLGVGCRPYGRSVDSETPTQLESPRLLRIRALSVELDAQRQFAVDRGKTQEAKASFILVVVGLVAGLSSAQLAGTSLWAVGLFPIALALAAAVMAVLVLWPRTIDVVDAGSLVNKWVESEESQEALEDHLLESRSARSWHAMPSTRQPHPICDGRSGSCWQASPFSLSSPS